LEVVSERARVRCPVDGGMIVTAHQYLTDPDMIEKLGLIP
jgi:hypothetical protein